MAFRNMKRAFAVGAVISVIQIIATLKIATPWEFGLRKEAN